MNLFKLIRFNRKIMLLYSDENIFLLHSIATESKKDEIWVQNDDFEGNLKSLNKFILTSA